MPTRRRRTWRPQPRQLVIRVDLLGAKPPIWRRLSLASDLTLAHVHLVLQTAFAWHDAHLHEFVVGSEYARGDRVSYSPPEFELGEMGLGMNFDSNDTYLGDVMRVPGDRLTYVYDFGDSWRHGLVLEKVVDRAPDDPAARCLAGRRATPPEDSGGIWQYEYMMEVGFDPNHPGFADAQEWVEWAYGDGPPPDPAAFDVNAMDQQLTVMFAPA